MRKNKKWAKKNWFVYYLWTAIGAFFLFAIGLVLLIGLLNIH